MRAYPTALAWLLPLAFAPLAAGAGGIGERGIAAEVRGPGRPFAGALHSLDGGALAAASRAAWLEALKSEVSECGIEEVRLLGPPAVGRNFTFFDDVLDRLVEWRVRPRLTLQTGVALARAESHFEERFTVEERRHWPPPAVAPAASSLIAPDFGNDVLPAATYLVAATLEEATNAGLRPRTGPPHFAVCDDPIGEGSDEPGIFHGGRGLVTYRGVAKPVFHAHRFLKALGDEVLATGPGGIVTRRSSSGRLIALLYNLPATAPRLCPRFTNLAAAEGFSATGESRSVGLSLSGLRPGGSVLIERIDLAHGNAVAAWRGMGEPADPGRGALEVLRQQARASVIEYRQADDTGRYADAPMLGPWSLYLLREL